jgi:hypothetical protein
VSVTTPVGAEEVLHDVTTFAVEERIHPLCIIGIHASLHQARDPIDHQSLIFLWLIEISFAPLAVVPTVE